MDFKEFSKPDNLEKNSFLWSEVRLLIAALALFLGGIPPVLYFNPVFELYGPLTALLKLSWLVSGAASAYLLYRWNANGKKVFGGQDQKDMIAFLVSAVSGINLGLVGLTGSNIGMSLASSKTVFAVTGVLYLLSAYHLWNRWNSHGKRLF